MYIVNLKDSPIQMNFVSYTTEEVCSTCNTSDLCLVRISVGTPAIVT
jgi:hypothetical protein